MCGCSEKWSPTLTVEATSCNSRSISERLRSRKETPMRAKFLHIADCHLGYRQYNLAERYNDFGRAFHRMIDIAIAEKVDFVLLAGDLFHKRAIDALTLIKR